MIIIAAGLLIFLIFFTRTAVHTISGFFREARVETYSHLSFFGNFISQVKTVGILTREKIKLKEENQSLLAQLAYQSELERQNDFLREALDLPMLSGHELLDAGVFNFELTPEGHYLLINKGANDGLEKEDIVLSSSGILIGIVDEAFNNYSRVSAVTDIKFKATIRVLAKEISGIANGVRENGVSIDFISQNDEVVEGDTVVTSGSDIFPPGLIIGKVVKVSSASGSLFKEVKVKPAMDEIELSRVLVIK